MLSINRDKSLTKTDKTVVNPTICFADFPFLEILAITFMTKRLKMFHCYSSVPHSLLSSAEAVSKISRQCTIRAISIQYLH